MIQEKGIIMWNREIGPSYYKIGVRVTRGFSNAVPGQFVMVRIPGGGELILRRPFSIHSLITETGAFAGIEILYKVVGRGTAQLSEARKGDPLDILGPLGKGFALPEPVSRSFLIGGGMGIAPLIFLAAVMEKKGMDMGNVFFFMGAASKKDLLCIDEVKEKGISVHATTEDGSFGEMGLVTALLNKAIEDKKPDMIYACGPVAMLKHVSSLTEAKRIPCQVSLETLMACGMGACLGCAVKNRKNEDRYDHVCVDGPVFDLADFQF